MPTDDTSQEAGGLQGLMQGLQNYGNKFSNFWLGGSNPQVPPAQPQPKQASPRSMAPPQNTTAATVAAPQGPVTPASMAKQTAQYNQFYKDAAAKNPEAFITGYRFNATKPKEGLLESTPIYYPLEKMSPLLDAYKDATTKYNVPKLSPETLAAMSLAEGRADFGYNNWDINNKKVRGVYEKMVGDGHSPEAAGFVAAIYEKQGVAKRLGIPFEKAWNGTGKSKAGKTGNDYVENVNRNLKALQHQKNKPLYDFIKSKVADANTDEAVPAAAKGGKVSMPKQYSEGNWKLI